MKKHSFMIVIVLTFILEIVMCVVMLGKMNIAFQDVVAVNECLHSVSESYGDETQYSHLLDYAVIDRDGKLVYQTRDGISTTINAAIKHSDTILDVVVEDQVVAKMLVHNDATSVINAYRMQLRNMLIAMTSLQFVLVLAYYFYLRKNVLKPFEKMNAFAVRVASGNLDVPLELDKCHVFGSFTEAFDLMRSELRKAKIAEKKANDEKKEVIAKLSHDIKTPVASIKSSSEFGYEVASDDKSKQLFNQINVKSDQITTLVDNLFNSSVGDVTEIAVNPMSYPSDVIGQLLDVADFEKRMKLVGVPSSVQHEHVLLLENHIPPCQVFVDKLRLQQAFDNIFMNSYKYAQTDIEVEAKLEADYLVIRIRDFGEGVLDEELPLLKEKFKRGSNITEKEGAGLGLYLANFYMEKMNGRLALANAKPGFEATFYIRTV